MWLELTFACDSDDADTLGDGLAALGALAVTLSDAADRPLYEPAPGETPLWARTRVKGLFPAGVAVEALVARLRADLAPLALSDPRVEPLEDKDWVRESLADLEPVCFGDRLWVVPTGHDCPRPGAPSVTMDPGIAFGTGSHPSTALCLDWLAARLRGDETVIDYGCGSGILALAAARLGARRVWAVDHDAQAIAATRRHASRNALEHVVTAVAPEAVPAVRADLLVANILANTLVELRERIVPLLRPGAHLALSGILEHQSDEVVRAYSPACHLTVTACRESWVLLAGVRAASPG